MKEVIHFNSTSERLAYLKGEFEEIIPTVAKEQAVEEEPKQKPKKKKGKKKDEVQAE